MRALALIFAVACSTGALAASPMIMLTVEGAAASADRVVVGRVKSVATVNLPQAPHFNSWQRITIAVTETLKGPTRSEVDLYEPGDNFLPLSESQWYSAKSEFLFCLVKGSRYARCDPKFANVPLMLRARMLDYYCASPFPLDAPANYPALSLAFSDHLSRDDIIATAKAFCGSGVTTTMECIEPPRNVNLPLLAIPRNALTESLARHWARSPDITMRWNAARVLRYTQSAENIAALRDIAAAPIDRPEGPVTRTLAEDTLRKWHVPVPQTSTQIPPNSSTTLLIGISASVLVGLFYLRRGEMWRVSRLFTAAMIMCGVALAIVGYCSYSQPQGWESATWELAFREGKLVLVYRTRLDTTPVGSWHRVACSDLSAVDVYFRGECWGCGILPGQFDGGMNSWGEEICPIWTTCLGIAVPMWKLAVAALVPIVLLHFIRFVIRWRARRRKGFEVLLISSPTTFSDVLPRPADLSR